MIIPALRSRTPLQSSTNRGVAPHLAMFDPSNRPIVNGAWWSIRNRYLFQTRHLINGAAWKSSPSLGGQFLYILGDLSFINDSYSYLLRGYQLPCLIARRVILQELDELWIFSSPLWKQKLKGKQSLKLTSSVKRLNPGDPIECISTISAYMYIYIYVYMYICI